MAGIARSQPLSGRIKPYFRQSGLEAPLRRARGLWREAPVWAQMAQPGRGPAVAFLPSTGRKMSALLRIYTIAGALRRRGWRTVVLPASLDLAQRRRLLDWFGPDVVVMQGARHTLNRPALYPGHRIVYDMDDADFHLDHLAGPVAEAMRGVDLVLAGSRYVAKWCRGQGAEAQVVWTGTPVSRRRRRPQADRPPIVAWAQSAPGDYHRERAFVRDVMTRVTARHPGAVLRLYGRRPGQGEETAEEFRAAGILTDWLPETGYRDYLRSFDDVAVGLSPVCPENPFSRGKSFGKILAYLDRGVPVITSDAADHELFFRPGTGVVSNDPAVWAEAICELLEDAALRQAMATLGFADFRDRLTTQAAARQVDGCLRDLLEADGVRLADPEPSKGVIASNPVEV